MMNSFPYAQKLQTRCNAFRINETIFIQKFFCIGDFFKVSIYEAENFHRFKLKPCVMTIRHDIIHL